MSSPSSLSFSRFFKTVRTGVAAFFKHDLALKRADDGVHIVLRERPPKAAKAGKAPTREAAAVLREQQELALMRSQLDGLLGELPETRETLRHLVFVEQALAKRGLRALHRLPLDVLQRALEQLEGLVINWSPVGLAGLRSKMAVAIIDREHMDPEAEADAYRTAAVLDPEPSASTLEASERSDDEALAAAYAALGSVAPSGVETQAELGSPSARAVSREGSRDAVRDVSRDAVRLPSRSGATVDEIQLRELHS